MTVKKGLVLCCCALVSFSLFLSACGGSDANNKADKKVETSKFTFTTDQIMFLKSIKIDPPADITKTDKGCTFYYNKELIEVLIGRLQVQIEQDLSSNYISGIHLIKKSVEQFIRSVVA